MHTRFTHNTRSDAKVIEWWRRFSDMRSEVMLSRDYVVIDCGRRGASTLIVNVASSADAYLIVGRE